MILIERSVVILLKSLCFGGVRYFLIIIGSGFLSGGGGLFF